MYLLYWLLLQQLNVLLQSHQQHGQPEDKKECATCCDSPFTVDKCPVSRETAPSTGRPIHPIHAGIYFYFREFHVHGPQEKKKLHVGSGQNSCSTPDLTGSGRGSVRRVSAKQIFRGGVRRGHVHNWTRTTTTISGILTYLAIL
jgi:hypothetical protein